MLFDGINQTEIIKENFKAGFTAGEHFVDLQGKSF
jgi:hypothetical protein